MTEALPVGAVAPAGEPAVSLTLGTAGHVDHGKTALVERLTGTNTDRLEEERRRGISIELGYARLELDGLSLSVVDVPGHERFVRTMVAGAAGIDLALLCVACDDGVMPQTREHLAILELLGVAHGVVALTKRDLVDDEDAELARLELADLLAGSRLGEAAVVEVSVRDGRGIEDLRRALAAAAGAARRRPAVGLARLPVDRVFSLRGIGTVVTGTLLSGTLCVGDQTRVVPGGRSARVRSLQVHDRPVEAAAAGQRVAAALVGLSRRELLPGETLVAGGSPPRSYRLDVRLLALPDGPGIADGARVEVLHGTASLRGRVVLLDGAALGAGQAAPAQLRLDTPVAALRGDRAVVRQLAPPLTVAGAVVLDPAPPRHRGGADDRRRLAALEGDDAAGIVAALLGGAPASRDALVARGVLDAGMVDAALAALVASGDVVDLGDGVVLRADVYTAIAEGARRALDQRARAHPLDPSLPVHDLPGDGPAADAVVDRLERDGVLRRQGARVALPGAHAASAAAGAAAASLLGALGEAPFAPPRLDDALAALPLAPRERQALVQALEREGELVRLPDGLAVTGEAYRQARELVVRGCEGGGSYTLAELRDATGSSRRYAQALLERLDADGVTRRVGDRRVLRRR